MPSSDGAGRVFVTHRAQVGSGQANGRPGTQFAQNKCSQQARLGGDALSVCTAWQTVFLQTVHARRSSVTCSINQSMLYFQRFTRFVATFTCKPKRVINSHKSNTVARVIGKKRRGPMTITVSGGKQHIGEVAYLSLINGRPLQDR
jgi:hypothetical protein